MANAYLHHVSVPTKDVEKAALFYTEVLGFKSVARPSFTIRGFWLQLGQAEVHVTDVPDGTYPKTRTIGSDDIHFAIRVADFDSVIERLNRFGYRDDLPTDDPKRIIIKPQSKAGYSQVYVMDHDFHLVEINAAFKSS
jgi:glyoxylase I family protein